MPLGEVGEICIKGPQVMAGYWNRPDETAKVMTEDGYFRSGDMGFMDENGYTKIVDRKKDMILVSGFNVYPNEIEEVAVVASGHGRGGGHWRAGRAFRRGGQAVRGAQGPEADRGRRQGALRQGPDQLQAARNSSSSRTNCRRPMSARSFAASCATDAWRNLQFQHTRCRGKLDFPRASPHSWARKSWRPSLLNPTVRTAFSKLKSHHQTLPSKILRAAFRRRFRPRCAVTPSGLMICGWIFQMRGQ
jgi:hypothetical protein